MWDIQVPRDIDRYDTERLRSALSDVVRRRLAAGKQLLRVVSWSANGAALFGPTRGTRRFAVAYEVALGA
ncbi:hypothetical protein H7J77_08355 [Mycolicibacillus parakoreensis]|nr:hypothetical protein [Mycolicibacillus parakoreensis]